MRNVDNVVEIAKLLGEDNAQRLKDGITDMLLSRVEEELQNDEYYLFNYEELFGEIEKEVISMARERVRKAYMEQAEKKIAELIEKL